MKELIDLSQEIYTGMPVYKSLPQVKISTYVTHEEWDDDIEATTESPAVNLLEFGEHTGTHVDALNHMDRANFGQSIDTMPLSMFYTEAFCLDFSQKNLRELITKEELTEAIQLSRQKVQKGDTILIYTNHYRKHFNTSEWSNGPGLTPEAAQWLGEQGVAGFGVETLSPGVSGMGNREVHKICGKLGFTHYENLINLHLLIGKGRFRFIAFPLKIRGGTGSPVRAVAIFE